LSIVFVATIVAVAATTAGAFTVAHAVAAPDRLFLFLFMWLLWLL